MADSKAGGVEKRRRSFGLRIVRGGAVLLVLLALALLLPLFPPTDMPRGFTSGPQGTAHLSAGPRYRAGPVRRWLLGTEHRDLWTVAIDVPVLDLATEAGGLTPFEEGGGMQTRSLKLRSADGRTLVFRSADKEPVRVMPSITRRSLIAWVLQDQTHSSHPAGAIVANAMQEAVGLPDLHPRLVVMPDDARLGPFRARFGGLLGLLLERPSDAASGHPVRGSHQLFAEADSGRPYRFDDAGFLTARLLDFVVNDWDRHAGQWDWEGFAQEGDTLWRPIPLDRDQALASYDGALMKLARLRSSKLSEFGPHFPSLGGLTHNSKEIDRRVLDRLPREAWDSVAAWMVTRLTDSVIDEAMAGMPRPYLERSGAWITAALKARRDGLPEIARRFYLRLHPDRTPRG